MRIELTFPDQSQETTDLKSKFKNNSFYQESLELATKSLIVKGIVNVGISAEVSWSRLISDGDRHKMGTIYGLEKSSPVFLYGE